MIVGPPAAWAGMEPAHVRVGRIVRDQLAETGHARRIQDLDAIAGLGVSAVRYPVLWGRGGSHGDGTDWPWATERLERLRVLGVEPIVGLLHHGFGPADADPLDDGWPDRFAAQAAETARRFPWVRRWLPINEPLTTARFAGAYGWWWPHGRDSATLARLLVAQCEAIRAATRAIREVIPDAVLIVNEDAGAISGPDSVRVAVHHDQARRWLTFDLLTGRVLPGHPLWAWLVRVPGLERRLRDLAADPTPPDILGVDYYVTSDRWLDDRIAAFPGQPVGEAHGLRYVDTDAVRVAGAPWRAWDRVIAEAWDRYRLPLALTEVHLAGSSPDEAAWWLDAWRAAADARAQGIEVVAVTAWAVFGAWDWATAMREHRRHWVAGCLSPARGPEDELSVAIRHAATGSGTPPEVSPGWWRDPARIRFRPGRVRMAREPRALATGSR